MLKNNCQVGVGFPGESLTFAWPCEGVQTSRVASWVRPEPSLGLCVPRDRLVQANYLRASRP